MELVEALAASGLLQQLPLCGWISSSRKQSNRGLRACGPGSVAASADTRQLPKSPAARHCCEKAVE